jgi:hypothetical protein
LNQPKKGSRAPKSPARLRCARLRQVTPTGWSNL